MRCDGFGTLGYLHSYSCYFNGDNFDLYMLTGYSRFCCHSFHSVMDEHTMHLLTPATQIDWIFISKQSRESLFIYELQCLCLCTCRLKTIQGCRYPGYPGSVWLSGKFTILKFPGHLIGLHWTTQG